MSDKPEEEKVEKPEEFKTKDMLIEGCVNDKARDVISQMLERRLTELDATGLQAKFIMQLQNELNAMPTCQELTGQEETEAED